MEGSQWRAWGEGCEKVGSSIDYQFSGHLITTNVPQGGEGTEAAVV